MARARARTRPTRQFFICFDDARFLDKQYTVWGKVVDGMEDVDKIKRGEPVRDPDKIVTARVGGGGRLTASRLGCALGRPERLRRQHDRPSGAAERAACRALGSPVAAAAVSFAAGAAALIVTTAVLFRRGRHRAGRAHRAALAVRGRRPHGGRVRDLLDRAHPRLGAAVFIGFAVAGQLIAGLVLDHYGLLGLAVREASPGRLAGVALLIAGAVLLRVA